jgi:eukaryotic-like serine/threonine-protein kinase
VKTSIVDQLGAALGPAYTIERELEGGGMARVFVAFDDTLQRRVAVKVLPEHMAAAVSVDRFRREILLSAGLQHPHIVGVLSAGVADGLPYFVMPYVDGESLGNRLLAHGRLTVPQSVSIMKDVARALAYAHERGVVHRDIKPQNILLASGAATVTDFGVAKALSSAQRSGEGRNATLTDAGTSLGTPLYMAPEQAAADPDVDHRADIYAFGVTAYEMLIGEPPFAGLAPRALMAARMTEDPPHVCGMRPDVPQVLADLVMRCVERDPADRPQSATELLAALDDPAMVSGAFGSATGARARWRRTRRWSIAAVLLLATAGIGVALTARSRRTAGAVAASAGAAAAPAPAVSRVVVLPLVSIGGDSANGYLAEGITNELASALSRVPGVQVVSPSRAAALLTAGRSPSDVGRELGVTRQLEGTVQREGNRLRVTARLVDVRDGTMTWSDMYERDVTDLLSVQDELTRVITGAIREAIGARLQPSDTAAPAPATIASSSSAAYDLYLRGRFQLNRRGPEQLRQAIAYFEAAIAKDRDLAPAYSGLAAAQGLLPLHANVSAERSLADGLRNADRAIALDSNLAEAWAARGVLNGRSWRWADAERDFRRAIAIDPANAAAHQWLGELLMVRGRMPEAVAALQRASQLDAGSPVAAGTLGLALALAGRTPEAVATAERAVSYDSAQVITRIMLGGVQLYARRPAEALSPLQSAVQMDPSSATALGLLGYTHAVLGDADAAHRMTVRVEALPPGPGKDVAVGRIALGLGDTTEALSRLERAARAKDPFFSTESARSPIFAPLLANARYQALLRSIGI